MLPILQALAEPNRFQIVELLLDRPRSVREIEERLGLNQPQASKHLRVLREAGLVDVRPQAQQRVYALRAQPMNQLHEWVERYRALWDARFQALDELVQEIEHNEKSRPAKKRRGSRAE
jgi:DNA-binding transcriptional ArsR family regulator